VKVIVRRGSRAKWKRRCECDKCGSTLEVVFADLKLVVDVREGDAYTFQCPVCGRQTWLAAALAPS
jgi:predicted RNA-binding Zn-ribbon protein involved in translation (DUF1610 family)